MWLIKQVLFVIVNILGKDWKLDKIGRIDIANQGGIVMDNILSAKSEEELKSMGRLKDLRIELLSIVGENIKIRTDSWKHLYESILAINRLLTKCSETEIQSNNELYFKSEAEKYIFYLLELDGETRQHKLKINKLHYANPKTAENWRNMIAKKIHPDNCKHIKAEKAMAELNKIYQEMVK